MPGFDTGSVMYALNVDFTGNSLTAGTAQVLQDGQLLIGSAVTPNIRVGKLTSLGGTLAITNGHGTINLEVNGGAPYISLSPFIVGSDIHSGYSTISAGISAAIGAGASTANPMNVYVKPGTYTENITGADGVNVIGFSSPAEWFDDSAPYTDVKLNGTITLSSGNFKMQGINLIGAAANLILHSGGNLWLFQCCGKLASQTLIQWTTATTKTVYINRSVFVGDASSAIASHDGSAATNNVNCTSGEMTFLGTTTFSGASGSCSVGFQFCLGQSSFVWNCPTMSFGLDCCDWYANPATTLLTTSASTTSGNIVIVNSDLNLNNSNPPWSLGHAGIQATISNCNSAGNFNYPTWAASSNRQGALYISNPPAAAGSAVHSALVYNASVVGWAGSESITNQAFLQTTSASAQTLISITPAAGTSLVVQGTIVGSNAGHTDITGGNFMVVCDGTAAAIIGSPVINVNASTTGTISATFSGGAVLIQVTAPSVAAYNWTSTYQYQQMISNS